MQFSIASEAGLVLGRFSHDPGSGLAGILFEKPQSAAGNTDYVSKSQLLTNAEGLDFGRSNRIGRFYDLEYRLHPVCLNHITNLGIVIWKLCHADSFPQVRLGR